MTNEQLVIKIKAGEDVAGNMQQLYEQTKAFIHTVAMRYQGLAELEDLEQEGYLALYPAVDGYDPDKGVKFLTYAEWHIRQYIQRYSWMNGSSIRMSYHSHERVLQYKKICSSYMMQYGSEPSEYALAVLMGLSEEQVREVKRDALMGRVESLDSYLTEDEDTTLGETVPGAEDLEEAAVDQMAHKQLQATLWPLVDALPGKQGAVIRARYQDGMSLPEIAIHIESEMEEVQKLQVKAMKGLRKPSSLWKLRPFLPEADRIYSGALIGGGVEHFNRTWTSSTERTALEL